MIAHHLKTAAQQEGSTVRSSAVNVLNGNAYMTVIPHDLASAPTVAEQTRQCLATIEERLAMVGSDKSRIAHVTIWLAHLFDFREMTDIWNAWVDPEHPPVRACAEVGLAGKDLKVEMIVVADAS